MPEDIYAGLEERKPEVEVDESGGDSPSVETIVSIADARVVVGTVAVDTTWLDQLLASETAVLMGVEGGTVDPAGEF